MRLLGFSSTKAYRKAPQTSNRNPLLWFSTGRLHRAHARPVYVHLDDGGGRPGQHYQRRHRHRVRLLRGEAGRDERRTAPEADPDPARDEGEPTSGQPGEFWEECDRVDCARPNYVSSVDRVACGASQSDVCWGCARCCSWRTRTRGTRRRAIRRKMARMPTARLRQSWWSWKAAASKDDDTFATGSVSYKILFARTLYGSGGSKCRALWLCYSTITLYKAVTTFYLFCTVIETV